MADGYIAVNLKRHDDAGIAKITVMDETTSTELVFNQLVDLYHADFDDTNGEYEDLLYQVSLPDLTHSYSITVEHSGYHNTSAVGPDYTVEYGSPFITEKLTAGQFEAQMIGWHTDFSSDTYNFDLVPESIEELTQIVSFNGDDVTTEFTIPSNIHAYEFLEYSTDGGTTWNYSTDTSIYWGINSPNYDNETMDSNYNFTVRFLTAPATGTGNVQFKITALINRYKIRHTLKQPTDGIDYIDSRTEVRAIDYCLELIKD